MFFQGSFRRQRPQGIIGKFDGPSLAVRSRARDGLGVQEKGGGTGFQGIRGAQKFYFRDFTRIFEKDRQAGQGGITFLQPPQKGSGKPPGGLGGLRLPNFPGIGTEFFT